MKHEGLKRIAKQLNIGTDSLVFLDDNPAEIELIRQVMPEVECVLVPADPALRPACLNGVHSLDRAVITAEDLHKTRQYRDNAGRESARREFADLHDYLHSLQTRIRIALATAGQLPRVHQLFSKTNQFNVTTKRYSLLELQQVAEHADSMLLMVHAEDRFGDFGWIGAAVLRGTNQSAVHIDSFILSCRAMGRAIESAVLNEIKKLCFARAECLAITAEYIPTAKNIPLREFYEEHGFSVASIDASLHKHYRLDRDSSSLSVCEWIAVEFG